MDTFTKKEQILILGIALIIIFFLVFKFVVKDLLIPRVEPLNLISDIENEYNPIIEDDMESNVDEKVIIMVHVSGEVFNPGLVKLFLGDRVIDAVELAGGLKKEADIDRINLAKKLIDEEKIHIPKIGEEINIDISYGSNISNSASNNGGKININQCSSSDLESLPGIGKVTAGKIIEYRKSTPFKSIEEIKNVSGIGEKKYEAIKDLITTK